MTTPINTIQYNRPALPNIHGLNTKSLHSAYDVKTYILLIFNRPSDGNIKADGPLRDFRKCRLISALAFPFALSHLIFITHTLHHNNNVYTDPRQFLIHTVTHHGAMWPTDMEIENGSQFPLYPLYSGAQMLNWQ